MINNVRRTKYLKYKKGKYRLRELINEDYELAKIIINPITEEDEENLKECLRECLCQKDVFIIFYKKEPTAIIQLEVNEYDEAIYRVIMQPEKEREHWESVKNLFVKMLCKKHILDDTQLDVWLILNGYDKQDHIYLPIL